VTKEVKNHGVWAANPICASSGLVPFAVNRARELAAAGRSAGHCSWFRSICMPVLRSWRSVRTCQTLFEHDHGERHVHVWNTNAFASPARMFLPVCDAFFIGLILICHSFHSHVFILALQGTQGEAWATAFKRWDVHVDPCYKLYPEEVRQMKMETVNALLYHWRKVQKYVVIRCKKQRWSFSLP
jgi:hypothetical protein